MSVKEAVGLTGKHKLLVAAIIGATGLFIGWQMATHGYFGAKVQAKATSVEAKFPQKTTTQ